MNEVTHEAELDGIALEAGEVKTQLAKARSRGLVRWTIRWALTIALYAYFWEHTWIRWTLIVTVPLGLFSLYMHTLGYHKVIAQFDGLDQQLQDLDDETD